MASIFSSSDSVSWSWLMVCSCVWEIDWKFTLCTFGAFGLASKDIKLICHAFVWRNVFTDPLRENSSPFVAGCPLVASWKSIWTITHYYRLRLQIHKERDRNIRIYTDKTHLVMKRRDVSLCLCGCMTFLPSCVRGAVYNLGLLLWRTSTFCYGDFILITVFTWYI